MIAGEVCITPHERKIKDWADYGIRGKIHYGRPIVAEPYRRVIGLRVSKALSTLCEFFETIGDASYVAVSFGVDSLVACDLARRLRPAVRAAWVNQGPLAEWPDCLALKDLMVAEGLSLTEIAPDVTLYDWYRLNGIPYGANMNNAEDERLNKALLYEPINRFHREQGMRGAVWGLRWRGEGNHRAFVIKGNGELYTRKADGITVCSPVGNWTKAEIWAYIDLHGLPYPAFYDIDREKIRNGPPIGVTGLHMGRLVRFRQLFPEMWRVFCMEFEEIQRYG